MNIAILGGGPAGLRAAEVAAEAGASVTLYEKKPSVGRKFLVAGRGGLNITKHEPHDRFVSRYLGSHPDGLWDSLIRDFDNTALREWARGLGLETFVASTGRVYPTELKGAPLLRRWVARLRQLGVVFAMNHEWESLAPRPDGTWELRFANRPEPVVAHAVILALGGASWSETGSDGKWTSKLPGIPVTPLAPANCGWEIEWPPPLLAAAEGKPLKNIVASAGGQTVAAELLITRYGLEGGAMYALGATLRALAEPVVAIDLKPSFTEAQLIAKMQALSRGASLLEMARQRWKLGDAAFALLTHFGNAADLPSLAASAKAIRLPLLRPRPIDEAISSAGGIPWSELNDSLMLKRLPGIFAAGEMIDWEAPTGGYLLQGCFATGTRAGRAAVRYLTSRCA